MSNQLAFRIQSGDKIHQAIGNKINTSIQIVVNSYIYSCIGPVTMQEKDIEKKCALCQRIVHTLTWHHLVPKEEGGRYSETIPLCQPCHSTIHNLFTNKELKKTFHTIKMLQSAERLQVYLQWIRNTSIERITNKGKRKRK